MEIANWATLVIAVLSLFGLGTIALLWRQSRDISKQQRAIVLQMILEKYSTLDINRVRFAIVHTDYRMLMDFGRTDAVFAWIAGTFNDIAYYARENLVDERIIRDVYGDTAKELWEKMRPWVVQRHTESGNHGLYRSFASLASDAPLSRRLAWYLRICYWILRREPRDPFAPEQECVICKSR